MEKISFEPGMDESGSDDSVISDEEDAELVRARVCERSNDSDRADNQQTGEKK